MDLSIPGSTPNSPLTPVFGDNVQDLLNAGALNVNPTGIIVVNSIADTVDDPSSGVTTLRDAINQANGDTGEDLIVFDREVFSNAQTIGLNLGELDITHNLDIIAPRDSLTGADLLTVSGNNASRVFEIDSVATVNLSGLIIADGKVTNDNGGGILNSGTLTLDSSIISGNSAIGNTSNSGRGGGIYNSNGISTVQDSIISANSGSFGGGINNSGGISTVQDSTISANKAGFGGGGIESSDTLTVNNSLVSDNTSYMNGGGIESSGTLTVNNSTISENRTGTYNGGGGIEGSGVLTVSNSTIIGNQSYAGGGIEYRNYLNLNENMLTVNNSTISNNDAYYGGGISNVGMLNVNVSNSTLIGNSAFMGGGIDGNVVLSNSTLSGNSAQFGGGIYGNVVISNSTLSGNSAPSGDGGGIFGSGVVSNSTLEGNSAAYYGGGISSTGTLTVSNSTLSGNSAVKNGGGIFNGKGELSIGGTVNVSNSTFSGNTAGNDGGGIFNDLTLTLVSSTLTLNSASLGGGVFNDALGNASTRNTIIAANLNSPNSINPDVSGTFTSNGYNLIGDNTGSTGFDEAIGDIVGTGNNPIDPRLAPLDNNGGTTQTIALLPDSPAIGAGDPAVLDTDPTTDQRGLPRRAADGSADIGAFEFS